MTCPGQDLTLVIGRECCFYARGTIGIKISLIKEMSVHLGRPSMLVPIINMEPLELLHLQPSEPIASDSMQVVFPKDYTRFALNRICPPKSRAASVD